MSFSINATSETVPHVESCSEAVNNPRKQRYLPVNYSLWKERLSIRNCFTPNWFKTQYCRLQRLLPSPGFPQVPTTSQVKNLLFAHFTYNIK